MIKTTKTCLNCLRGPVSEDGFVYCTSSGIVVAGVTYACDSWEPDIHDDKNTEDNAQAAKADAGKIQLSLVPPEAIEAIAEIRRFGTQKYSDPDNWKRVEAQRYWEALLRHALAMWNDWTSTDEESGMPHLWHLMTNGAFLCALLKKEQYHAKGEE